MISIHSTREGGDDMRDIGLINYTISIHSTREGGDTWEPAIFGFRERISIHSTREGGDPLDRPMTTT